MQTDVANVVREVVGVEGTTLPLLLVGLALAVVGLALYAIIVLARRPGS